MTTVEELKEEKMRDNAREMELDAMWAEFNQQYDKVDILEDLVKNFDEDELIEVLGDYYTDHKQQMFEEWLEMR